VHLKTAAEFTDRKMMFFRLLKFGKVVQKWAMHSLDRKTWLSVASNRWKIEIVLSGGMLGGRSVFLMMKVVSMNIRGL